MINHRILEEVSTTGPRWRSLKTRLGTFDVPSGLSLLSRLAECRLDNLEELDVGTFSTIDRFGGIDLIAVPRPRLRNLTIRIHGPSRILVLWAQLTDLTATDDSLDLAMDILARCPNLVRTSVTAPGCDALPRARNILGLTHLHTLSLAFVASFGNRKHVTPLLDYTAAPVLERLCLDAGGMERYPALDRCRSPLYSAPAACTTHYPARIRLRGPHIGPATHRHSSTLHYPSEFATLQLLL
ncbi:hypothetical protein K438DRAFT_1812287 [Mycena galopus ATCC 62051]|nr:hypothetical protein K438DRAFT_1812287 [Mycena galopus ATCC 62051]